MWLSALMFSLLATGSGLDVSRTASHPPDRPAHLENALAGHFSEPPTTLLQVGDPAPDFAFEGFDGHVMRLHHVLDQGAVLLVFAPREADLRRLQEERGTLLDLGIVPVAIVDTRPNAARTLVRRLGLQYSVLADTRGVIADQFNVVDGGRMIPSWFALDARGHVRGLVRAMPAVAYALWCARALALPLPGVAFPTAHRP